VAAATGAAGGERRVRAPRADARRNREAIVVATVEALRQNPDASVAQIAATAGVGRMTLYGHFESRAALLEAALVDVLERGNQVLETLDLEGDPGEALERLVRSSWALLDDSRALLSAAQRELSPGRIRDLHEKIEGRVRRLIERGQDQGAFRPDVPVSWLAAVMHALMHAAAEEVAAERMSPDEASALLATSVRSAFAPDPSGR
jgi:AcrR family transcriptional regulator